MGFWKRFWKDFVGAFKKGPREEEKHDRYEPGGLSSFMGQDMKQVKDRFRGAFGDHYDDKEEQKNPECCPKIIG